ncbi:sugar O-acetyltransferase [uncultured Victivallis sp.]|uniref:sugar O-acetyltransferase n=1 Tax=uncultured Victivallis sp. TaxID=354118 RepID=UPI00345D6552
MTDTRERMKDGRLYFCTDEEIANEQLKCLDLLYDYNQTRPTEQAKRRELLKVLLAEVGENCYIEPPLHANWGRNTHLGSNVYANFNLTLVDDTDVYIGDSVMIGPNVTIATAGHPIDPELRRKVAQFNIPVRIGNNVWIGAGAVILPGITIGDDSVIGAGSIVTKDIPAGVVAVGNPCRVLRPICDRDREFYYKDRKVDLR